MNYRISLSYLFKEQLRRIKETDEDIVHKKVLQNIKDTAKGIEKLEKSGFAVHDMTMRNKVPGTGYSTVYKIRADTKRVLIAKKILKRG